MPRLQTFSESGVSLWVALQLIRRSGSKSCRVGGAPLSGGAVSNFRRPFTQHPKPKGLGFENPEKDHGSVKLLNPIILGSSLN